MPEPTKECPSCAMEVEKGAEICPICGYDFPHTPLHLKLMAVIMIVLLILYLVF